MFGLARIIHKARGKAYYSQLPPGLLLLNWMVQRIFGINRDVPFSVHYTSIVKGYQHMKLDPSVRLSFAVSGNCHIAAAPGGLLTIGSDCVIATGVCIQTANHDLIDKNVMHPEPVTIGNNVWIGHGAVILPGVTLGDGVVVGAHAVVTHSFPNRCVIAGNPARVIREI